MRVNQISLPYPLPDAIRPQYARLTLLVLVLTGVALLRDQLPWLTEVPAVLINFGFNTNSGRVMVM